MSNVMSALKRKIGPLPAWGWAIIAGVLVYYFRRKLNGGTLSTSSALPTDTTAQQSPVVLQPGESAYNPNTGGLVTAPGGDTSGSSGGDMATALEDLASALQAATTTATPGDTSQPGTTSSPKKHRGKRSLKSKHKPKRKDKGAAHSPSDHRKHRHRSTASVKDNPRGKAQTTGHGAGQRTRRRTITVGDQGGNWDTVGGVKPKVGKVRTRYARKTPMTKPVIRQRPVASHPTHPEAHNTPHTQHRQPRTHRKHRGK